MTCNDNHDSNGIHTHLRRQFGKPRSVSVAVLVSLSACGPAELTGQGGTDESTDESNPRSAEVDVESGPAPLQLESRAAGGSLEWLVAESEWSVGGGRRELTLIDLGEGPLDIAGSVRDFPDGGWPLWTAKIDPDGGALTRGCVHMVEDPETGEPMRQRILAGASGPAGGLAIYGNQGSPDPLDPGSNSSYWVWMRYIGGY